MHEPTYYREDDPLHDSEIPPPDRYVSVAEFERWRKGLLGWVLGLASVASAVLTYQGLREFLPVPTAAMLAAISFVLAFSCWRFVALHWPRAGSAQGELALRLVVPVPVLVVLTSTISAWMGLGLPEAQRLALSQRVDIAYAEVEQLKRRRGAEAALLPVVSAEAGSWAEKADDERLRGRFFRKGAGSIYGGMVGISRGFADAERMLEEDRRRFTSAAGDAEKSLAAMRRTVDGMESTGESVREGSTAIATELLRLNESLAELDRSSLEAALLAIEGSIGQQSRSPLTGKTDKLRAQEGAAKEAIASMAGESMASVRRALRDVDRDSKEAPLLRVPMPIEALAEQLPKVLHLAAFPIAIDLFLPLFCLMALSYLQSRLVRRPAPVIAQREENTDDRSRPQPQGSARLSAIASDLRRARSGG